MKRSRINPISKSPHRIAKRFVPLASIRAVKKRSGGICEVVFVVTKQEAHPIHPKHKEVFILKSDTRMARCVRTAMPVPHHLLKRSQGGGHGPDNLLDACFHCHDWIERHPKEAAATGLNIPYEGFNP